MYLAEWPKTVCELSIYDSQSLFNTAGLIPISKIKILLGNVASKSLDEHIRLAVVAAAPDFWLVRSEILNSTSRTALPTEKSQKWHNQTPGMSDLGMLVWWGWGGLPKNHKIEIEGARNSDRRSTSMDWFSFWLLAMSFWWMRYDTEGSGRIMVNAQNCVKTKQMS